MNLYGQDDYGHLNLNLFRYGFSSPGTYVKVIIPNKSNNDEIPIICLSGLGKEDIYESPLSATNEYSLKLAESGKTVSYYLNIDGSNTAYTQASTKIDFGDNTTTQVILPIEATLENRGSAGNGLTVQIDLDTTLNSSYAKCEVLENKNLIITVCESPFIC